MRSTRLVGIGAVVVLAAIVAGAVTLVATASQAPGVVRSSLTVGAGPPSSATAVLTYADSTGITAHAECAFDFEDGAADVTAAASLSVVTVDLEARLVERVVYLSVAQFASLVGEPWVSLPVERGPDRLEALATALRHPDLARLHPRHESVVHAPSGATWTTMAFGVVTVPAAGSIPIPVPSPAHLAVVVETGAQGQLLFARVGLANRAEHATLDLTMTGYDVPVSIAAPPAHDVAPLTPRRERQLFGTDAPAVARLLRGLRRVAG